MMLSQADTDAKQTGILPFGSVAIIGTFLVIPSNHEPAGPALAEAVRRIHLGKSVNGMFHA